MARKPQSTAKSPGRRGLAARVFGGVGRMLGLASPGRSVGARLANLILVVLVAAGAVYGLRARQAATSGPEPATSTVATEAPSTDAKTAEAPSAVAAPGTSVGQQEPTATSPSATQTARLADAPADDASGKVATETAAQPTSTDTAKPSASEQPAAAAPASGPLFNDTRPLADTPRRAAAAPTASVPSFRDARPLTETAAQAPAPRPAAAQPQPGGGLFRDARTLTPPSFHDERPVLAGSDAAARAAVDRPAPDPVTVAAAKPDTTPATDAGAAHTAAAGQASAAPSVSAPGAAAGPPFTGTGQPSPAAAAPRAVAAQPLPSAPQAAGLVPPTPPKPAGPTLVAVNAPPIRVDAAACAAPELSSEPLDGGRMRILVNASCRPGEAVQFSYGGAELIRKLDAFGRLDFVLDCFAGAGGSVLLRFADGAQQSLPVTARDLDRVSKFAVVWHAPVNLDLHVFEYAARNDQPGHLWAKAGSSLAQARAGLLGDHRGHGFISTMDDDASLGDKIEVYTFLHSDEQTSGAISLALDYETRGEVPSGANCGQGALAEIDFQIVMLPRGGQATRQPGVLTRVECGRRIAREARLNPSALPGLRIRR